MYLALQAPDASTSVSLAERIGLPASFLLVVLLFLWKCIWPLILELIASLKQQIEEARIARQTDQTNFLIALDKRDAVAERSAAAAVAATQVLADKIDDLCEEVKRR